MLDFDTMLMHVGEFGLYQKLLFTFQAPFCIFVTFVLFGQLFMVLYPVNYWCDNDFRCITLDSNISAAQRMNISLRWRDRGLFRDRCQLNTVDDNLLRSLQRWSSSGACPSNSSTTTGNSPSSSCDFTNDIYQNGGRAGQKNTRNPNVPPPKLQYGGYYANVASDWEKPGSINPTEYPDDGNHDYDKEHYHTTTTTQRTGASGRRGGYGGNAGNKYTTTTPKPRNNYGNNGEDNSWPGKPNSNGKYPQTEGSSGSRPADKLERSPQNAFVGWLVPPCERERRTKIVVPPNAVIQASGFNLTPFYNIGDRNSNCTIRWNQSELGYATIVTQLDWWCNAELYVTIAQSVFFLGAIVGGFLIGWIADTFGRVPALVLANLLGAIGGALSAFSPDIVWFCIFRFITGMAFDNCFTMMYILVLEFCGPTYRTLVANLSIAVFYTLGTIAIPVLAWLIADWKTYALVISLPMLISLLALFFVPESARWLLSKGKAKQATNILRSFAKVNRKKVAEHIFVDFEQEATKLFSQMEMEEEEPGLMTAFKTPRLRRTFILLTLIWALIALVYDGHSRNIMNLANDDLNVFWMFGIASLTEFPADMLLIFTLDRFGRRWLAFGSMTLSGAFSFIAAVITPTARMPFLITAIISRFWVNVAFNIGLQYAAELLPTVIRAQGVNAIHIMGYVASIISPFVAAIGRDSPSLSLILLGAFSVSAGFLSLFLAETLGEELPNTLEEAEAFGKDQSFWNCPICAKERDEFEIVPAALEERPVVLRNALRGSIRGETYRSSMISQSSGSSSRRSQFLLNPTPGGDATETTRLRRGYTH